MDKGREPEEEIPDELTGVKRLTENHMVVWQAIRSRTARAEPCTRTLIRDDLKAMGEDAKNLTRTISKLADEGLITIDGEQISPVSHSDSTRTIQSK